MYDYDVDMYYEDRYALPDYDDYFDDYRDDYDYDDEEDDDEEE